MENPLEVEQKFADELSELINRFTEEHDITYSQMTGLLFGLAVKLSVDTLNPEEENDDGFLN